jgi:folate-binding protein YgfZ
MVTGDTKTLETGQGRHVFFTSAQGRILSEARVTALTGSLLLELPWGCAEPISDHLSRYIVADRVEITPRLDLRALTLVGPAMQAVAARFSLGEKSLADRWSQCVVDWQGGNLLLSRDERLGAPAITVRVTESAAQQVAAELLCPLGGVAARPVGFAAAEALRVEAGQARFGPDFDAERFPQEVGESDALDFDKGCYLGQEVVARIHYRGKVNHRLCGLWLRGETLPEPGSPVELNGAEVGRSGSAVDSPAQERGIALAVVHRKAELGASVVVAGVGAEITALPFVTD